MKRRTSNTYKLIPSKQSRSNSTAPMSFIPALPVRLNRVQDELHYALLDPTKEISMVDISIFDNIDNTSSPYTYAQIRDQYNQMKTVKVINISVFLCSPTGEPWLEFHYVPFIIAMRDMMDNQHLILGYDSLLSHLRLTLDFPRKELRVSTPIGFEILLTKKGKQYLPSSIIDAENLINIGSYQASLPMIVFGLEEVLMTKFNEIKNQPITYLLEQNWLSNKTKSDLKKILELRNHAVHGFGLVKIEKKDAQMALRTIKKIIEYITINA